MATRLEDLGPKLDALSRELEKIAIDIPFLAATFAEGELKGRVWGSGGAKAADGSTLPQYSRKYLKQLSDMKSKGKSRGMPTTSTWDLDRTGDLRTSIDVVSTGKGARLVIVGPEQVKKAEGLEHGNRNWKGAGKVIFELSDQETENVRKQILLEFRRLFQSAIKKVF